jgi:hypothetical protein
MRLSSLVKRVAPCIRDPHACDFDKLAARFGLFMRDGREPAADEPSDRGDAKAMRREQWSRHTIASCASKQADRTALLRTEAHRRHRTNAPRASKASLERRRGRLFAWIVHSGLAIFTTQTARERRGFQCVMAAVCCQALDRSARHRAGYLQLRSIDIADDDRGKFFIVIHPWIAVDLFKYRASFHLAQTMDHLVEQDLVGPRARPRRSARSRGGVRRKPYLRVAARSCSDSRGLVTLQPLVARRAA